MADYSDLKRRAQEIRDEVKAGANTANRVGVALEGIVNAQEDLQRLQDDQSNDIQRLQDETEDLQDLRDAIDVLGTHKADKSALEDTNKEMAKKQDTLKYYTEDTSTDTTVIKVSHGTDEATLHEDKVEVGVGNCVLLKSEDLILGEDSYIKVSPKKVSMSSPEGKITNLIQTILGFEARIANLEAQLTNTTEEQ